MRRFRSRGLVCTSVGAWALLGTTVAWASPPAGDPLPSGGSSQPDAGPARGGSTSDGGAPSSGSSPTGGINTGPTVIFQPPAGAQYDPTTKGEAGMINGGVDRPSDSTAKGAGYDIVDNSPFLDRSGGGYANNVPEYHVVQPGDTLSGICLYYFGDPMLWPRLWSYNEQITNAHWIFPGDRIRLIEPGARRTGDDQLLDYSKTKRSDSLEQRTYTTDRYAYISADEYDEAMKIYGAAEAKVMLSRYEMAYVSYEEGEPPIPGERLAVFAPKQKVYDVTYKGKKNKRQKRGPLLGYVVEITGEVQIGTIAEKSAEARIVDSVAPIERGQRVGELQTRFSRVTPTPTEVDEVGAVVEILRQHDISGETQFVVLNVGGDKGIRRGNILDVIHRGDEYTPRHGFETPYEEGHPRRVIASVLVLQVEDGTSLGLVIDSKMEVYRGDRVEARNTRRGAVDEGPRPPRPASERGAEASGSGKAKTRRDKKKSSGEAKGELKFRG